MKKTAFAIFMALILLSGLAACDQVKIEIKEPKEEPVSEVSNEITNVENPTKQSSLYFDGVLSDFGDGMLLMSYQWNDTKDISVDGLVMWYGYRIQAQNRVSGYMKDGKDGLFIPEDEFESVIFDYFGLLPEHLRTSDTYNETEKSYIIPMALYDFAKTECKVTKAEVDNDTMKIYFSLIVGDNEPEDRVLTVDISNEKIRFISYL